MKIKLRHTGRLDIDALEHLATQEREIHGDCGWRQWELPVFADHGRNYVLEIDGEFAGVAQLIRNWDDPSGVYLAGFGLAASRQGRGWGTRFLKLLLTELAGQNVTAVELTVAPDNTAALKVYDEAGFKVIDRHDGKYGVGEDRLIMRLELREKQA